MLNLLKKTGKGITYIGMGSMFVMAMIGTISIDIVLIAWINKESRRHGSNGFLTGFLWGTMFSNRNSGSLYYNAGIMLLLSPVTTAVAIGLSFLVGVPGVGIALIMGWGAAFGLVGLGLAIYGIADGLKQSVHAAAMTFDEQGMSNSYTPMSRGFETRPGVTQQQNNYATDTYGPFFSSAPPRYDSTLPTYAPYPATDTMYLF